MQGGHTLQTCVLLTCAVPPHLSLHSLRLLFWFFPCCPRPLYAEVLAHYICSPWRADSIATSHHTTPLLYTTLHFNAVRLAACWPAELQVWGGPDLLPAGEV